MNFIDLAKRRFSVRSYKDIPVEEEKLMQVLEAGRIAPSACNYQPVHFVVVSDEMQKERVCSTYSGSWLKEAPIIIVACGAYGLSWRRSFDGKDHCDIDVAIAVDHMTLAATELGLGTCWVCAFDAAKCGEIIHLPDRLEAVVLMPQIGRASCRERV